MSDSNQKRASEARQTNINQPTYYEQSRACFKQAMQKGAVKYGEISQGATPHTWKDAAGQMVRTAWSAKNELVNFVKYGGMGFMEGISRQNPNDGRLLNNIRTYQNINQGRYEQGVQKAANHINKNSGYQQKAVLANKSADKNKNVSVNKGIAGYKSRAGSQSAGTSKNVTSGSSKGSGSGSGKSGGSSGGSSKGNSR